MPKKRKDGRYQAQVTIGHNIEGKPIIKYVFGRTIRELEKAKADTRAYFVDGAERQDDMPFGEYAEKWYRLSKEPTLELSTKTSYRTMLNKHAIPYFGDRFLRAISPGDIQGWLNQFAGMSSTTIDQAATTIRGIFGAAYQDGILLRDPTARLVLPKAAKPKKKRALTIEERNRILQTVGRHEHGFFLAILYYLGLRHGEALGLMWGDFDWENGLVHIQRDIDFKAPSSIAVGDLKTEESDRNVAIPDELLPMLTKHRGLPGMLVFHTDKGSPMSKASSERIWISLMIDAGFATPKEKEWKHKDIRAQWDPGITPHYLRHNYITMLWESGVDAVTAMSLVGHADYRTTVQVYTHLEKAHLRDAVVKINRVFSKPVKSRSD